MLESQCTRQSILSSAPRISKAHILLIVVLLLGGALYLQHSYQYFLHDDEGNYAYAAWRISTGEVPYRDFLTPQLPVFLYWGGLVVRLFGQSYVALRLATQIVTLLAACLLYALNRETLGRPVAILSLGLFLIQPNVFHNARFFLPEAYMQLFQLAGLYAFALGEKRQHLGFTALAGTFFGLSILSKLFGALPLAGCFLYLLYAWLRERRPWKRIVQEGLTLGLPALFLAGIVALLFSSITPYFFTATFEHHTMQGAGMALAERVQKALALYRRYVTGQPLAITLAMLGACLALWRRRALPSLLLWQVPTAAVFLLLSRETLLRHLTYLDPALATLVAVTLARLLSVQQFASRARMPWRVTAYILATGSALVLALATVRPWVTQNIISARLEEHASSRFATLIQSLSSSDEQVMSDYPGLNFSAGRRSTYWAGGISGGAAGSGQIRGANLIDEIERQNVAVVIINVSGHDPQMTNMIDYDRFRRYVQLHYVLADRFECSYYDYTPITMSFEVYARVDPMPIKPQLQYQNEIALQAVRISDTTLPGGSALDIDVRWQAIQKALHDYHASVLLVDAAGRQWAETHSQLCNAHGALTSGWQPQEMAWGKYHLNLNPAMPAGDYSLVIQPYYLDSGFLPPSKPPAGPMIQGIPVIATISILPPAEAATIRPTKAISYPLEGISFGPYFDLLGYDLSTTRVAPGETVQLALYWAYRQPSAIDYKVFTHLLDGASQVQGQQDIVPAGGGAQTRGWVQGDVLVDHFDIPLQASASKGTLQIEVGFYDLATGKRLPLIRDGLPTTEDRLILPTTITTP